MTMFGEEIRKEFTLREDYTFINHGSYGMVPKIIQSLQTRYQEERDSNPDVWYRDIDCEKWRKSRDAAAKFIDADPSNVVFVQNATTGINSVLKSLPWEAGDEILCTDNTFMAVQYACRRTSTRIPEGQIHLLTLEFPIQSEDDVITKYKDFIQNHPKIRLAVIDHITSPSAMVMPVQNLIQVCRDANILTFIDGAHAPGQIPLSMRQLNPDFYTGNFHKWMFTPRGCAFLYVDKKHHGWCVPLVTSYMYNKGISLEFFMQGTRDEVPYHLIPDAIDFFTRIGGFEKIREYTEELLTSAVSMLIAAFGTDTLDVPTSMKAPYMRLVRLPPLKGYDKSWDGSEKLYRDIAKIYKVNCAIFPVNGELYLRLSAGVYNTQSDYDRIRDVIPQLL